MDPFGSLIWRVVDPISPSWRARLLWLRTRRTTDHALIETTVRPGDIVVDVGANVGAYTDGLAGLVGPRGRVHAFEPHPSYASTLRRIAETRGNVTFVPAAVSDRVGEASLTEPMTNAGPSREMSSLETRGHPHETVRVPTTTLDFALAGVTGVRFLKCDAEGHEHEVLLGGLQMLSRDKPTIFIEIEQRHRQRPVAETFELLRELGYQGHTVSGAGTRPLTDFDVERDQIAAIADDPSTGTPPDWYLNDFLFVPRS